MKQKLAIVILSLLLLSANLFSQEALIADNNEALFNNYVAYITPFKELSFEEVLEQTAHFFLGTPYVAGTLEINDKEQLVVNLKELDCVSYVENVLALSLVSISDDFCFHNFKAHLLKIRYRNGELSDYASRIHYTSDWIFDNQRKKLLRNISQELSGVKETKELNFMSNHRNVYKQLLHDNEMLSKIKQMEKTINNRGGFYYLPKDEIAAKASEIPHMAIVGIVTSIDGLDTSHVGFAYNKDGELGFIHASSLQEKVVIDSKTLSEYCLGQKNCKGIIVAKIINHPLILKN